MDPPDASAHPSQSFVVRIWIEESRAGRSPTWRGHVTHVQSGQRRSVDSLGGISRIIATHIAAMGAPARGYERMWRFLMSARR
jgi:hypothetical protein